MNNKKTLEELKAERDLIKNRITELRGLIKPLEEQEWALSNQIAEMKSQLKVGDVIQWGRLERRFTGKIIRVEESWRSFYYHVNLIKKDGTFGLTRQVRDYDKPSLVNPPPTQTNGEKE